MEFHISRIVRNHYEFDDSLFSTNGNVIFANLHASRLFAQQINDKRIAQGEPLHLVRASEINAMGLIDEIMHVMVARYRAQELPNLYDALQRHMEASVGKRGLNKLIRAFLFEFPPLSVYTGKQSITEFLKDRTDGISNYASSIEEILVLWLANSNPAFRPYLEFFDDHKLKASGNYEKAITALHDFFDRQPYFGPDQQNLVDLLRSPALVVPFSLKGQLDYIRSRWGQFIGHHMLKLLGSLDMLSEEARQSFNGPGPIIVPLYSSGSLEMESEQFSPDAEWMPNLVMMAKNTYVWLDQLTKSYQRPITRLDQIPDEELERLAAWGFNGLWLIGLWERSRASARIKQLCGNPDAIASAYSLKEYQIARDLGGEEALKNLKERAWRKGIRLASDMVPNHMAIDSDWVNEHPDWFVSMPYSPFPSYSFNGENLSQDKNVIVQIEDHYFERTDAAVVFKYQDFRDGKTHYIYHGNDGTSMPWNDTAQLNYLNAEVREAVIQTILQVARRFPIIRFDAAMTLARRHYQRLWFPVPGSGCDIPSRSGFGMSQDDFIKQMPQEFWREVVDRVAVEAPNTLLLAEAFWLMEGYFVRTLGMHRVYNSAFMNLLRDEENAKYRQVMKNTLEFDPEILKRYVNFMNNPDEQTAANQFGKGDKYFGICTLMATMPGLPMFGHGQIEGFTEKYGMEYKRAYWDEKPDQDLVNRHEWQIFPLLKRRHLFSGVNRFYLYDFFTDSGMVDENVFAYSNASDNDRSLVVFHNRFGTTSGTIRTSAAFMDKESGAMRQVELRSGLDFPSGNQDYVIFRDQLSGLEYIRNCADISRNGLFFNLEAYKVHVFTDFQIVHDDNKKEWRHLCDFLNGRGTPDVEQLKLELPLKPILQPMREIYNAGYFNFLLAQLPSAEPGENLERLVGEAAFKMENLLQGARVIAGTDQNRAVELDVFRKKIEIMFGLITGKLTSDPCLTLRQKERVAELDATAIRPLWLPLVSWIFLDTLRIDLDMSLESFNEQIKRWRFSTVIDTAFWETIATGISPAESVRMTKMLLLFSGWLKKSENKKLNKQIIELFPHEHFIEFMQVNEYNGVTWFRKESADTLIKLLLITGIIELVLEPCEDRRGKSILSRRLFTACQILESAIDKSSYDLNRLRDLLI